MWKVRGVDGITSEILKYGGENLIERLTRVCSVCFMEGRIPEDWQRAANAPFYKGKGDEMECKNYCGISLLFIPGKVHRKVLIKQMRQMTED